MAKLQTKTLVALTTLLYTTANALQDASLFQRQDTAYYGGYGLNIDLVTPCPANTYSCLGYNVSGAEQTAPCCPTVTVCDLSGVFCCPTDADCSNAVLTNPTCGDPSWTLWVTSGAQICCPPGDFAQDGGFCDTTSVQSTDFTTTAQANNAAPTGDSTFVPGATTAASTTAASAPPPANTNTMPSAMASVQGSTANSAGNTPTSGSTGSAVSPSPTKSSADRIFAAVSGILVLAMSAVYLLS